MLHVACWKYRTQKSRQKSPSGHHRANLSGYIFATKARIDNRKKLVKQQYVLQMFPQYGELRPTTAAEIGLPVWGTPATFNAFLRLGSVTALQSSSGHQPDFAALNRGLPPMFGRATIRLGIGPHSSVNLECRSETCCARHAGNTGPKKVAKNRHLGTIAQFCRAISSQLRHVSTIGKKTC